MAQVERAIRYWRKHYAEARFNSADAFEEQLLTALYRRMLGQRMGSISLAQLSGTEIMALRCLDDIAWALSKDQ